MNLFDYVRPSSVAEAVAAASQPGAAYLAGGTNLMDLMKLGAARPDRLVDVTRLPGLDRIETMQDGGMRIGAMVRNADLARDPAFASAYPSVAEALLSGASPQLRNMATVGGNLLQHTRCAYFQDTASACNRREPGTGCDALGGENRTHAVLGWSDACIATHPSDFAVPLVALDAVVEIEGPNGHREVPLEDFHLLPGPTEVRETVLEARRTDHRAAPACRSARLSRPFTLSEAARTHLLRLRPRLGRRGAADRGRHDPLGATRARRGRRKTLARPRRRDAAGGQRARRRDALTGPPNWRSPMPDRRATTPSRSSSPGASSRGALLLAAAGTPQRMPALPASVFTADTGVLSHA